MKPIELTPNTFSYNSVDDKDVFSIISTIKKGVKFSTFNSIALNSPFSLIEWSGFLNISERTMQRYKKERKSFDSNSSEKIIEIALLFKYGIEVFGNKEKFNTWLETKNVALGGIVPKELLDNTFGINLLKDELTRIEYGVLA
ncbi:MAG TPA: antitoxin Xre/MbcA/ParS toxin-binding domain-containing protein [Hanamia sp.]|nr:antitoxin Xre/MbcA/ParS toxin-binding domain-containing protein [Hanamia sp.]